MAKRGLGDYEKKRDFRRTPEPAPAPPKTERPGKEGEHVFVVHRHDATRLHYDLRLERDGVLVSWAVPKGFSYDPDDKHLAVRTEDHPLEYEDFHGVIPKGQYGAGTMTIWDRGRYELVKVPPGEDPFAAGEVKVLLYGRRLRGEWHLVKTKAGPKHWLLFKSRDRYAGAARDSALGIDLSGAKEAALPGSLRKMRPREEAAPFSDPDWFFEAELTGRRVFAVKDGEAIRWRGTRRRLPRLEAELAEIRADRAVLDGVLVALDEHQRPSLELCERRLAGEEGELWFYAFDLLFYEDYDLRSLSLVDRKGGLRALLPPLEHVLFTDHVPGNGVELADAVSAAGLAGIVAKRAASRYTGGASADWKRIPVGASAVARDVPVAEALARGSGGRAAASGRVRTSNLDKVFWPAEGYTKGDLLAYYETVADVLLPYLADRAVHLNRFPDGIEGKSFYQKDAKEETPDWIRTVELESRHRGSTLRYMVCDDRDTLLYLANLGSIDLHPWMSRLESPDSPDYAVIDLDPKEAPFANVVTIARTVGDVLFEIGLRPLLKTSGKTGLHVVIPLIEGYTYDQGLAFCEGVARLVASDLSDIATVERVIGSREGKVYVDYGQNRKGQTVVPPYVVRPVRGATVSTPLAWDELVPDLTPAPYTILTVPDRLARLGDLFEPLFEDRQDLLPAAEALGDLVRARTTE